LNKEKKIELVKKEIIETLRKEERTISIRAENDAMQDSENEKFHIGHGENKCKKIEDEFIEPLNQKYPVESFEAEIWNKIIRVIVKSNQKDKNKSYVASILRFTWAGSLLWAALAYFIYGEVYGVAAIIILASLYNLSVFLALIPFCGVLIQGLVIRFIMWPWIMDFTGIHDTWLTGLTFWMAIIAGISATIMGTTIFLAWRGDR